MNGLLQQPQANPVDASAPPATGEAEPGPSSSSADDGEDSNVTPEEQAQYDAFVGNALKLAFSPETRGGILRRLAATGEPVDDLANAAVMVVQATASSAKAQNHPLTDDVVFHGGLEVLRALADYSAAAKIHDYSEKETTGAWYRALDVYREMGEKAGTVDGNSLKQQFGEIVDADKAGQLENVLPGIGKAAADSAGQDSSPQEAQS